ncbi:glutamine amidotransferase class-I family protein [Mycobacterium xenopi 4042]|uniref:Glutamine amidotransferase class-I family protein n=1 Tax=Mycobacterium xenopi 4042 TaxID=1299334 RepID=X7YRD5_MYCXE|nr:glutamine amidotransferase class-I family protein [Mycobacterium xenopi 4042]
MVATAPQIGNTGWNTEDSESRGDRIWVAGYAVRDPSPRVSNWRATTTLEDELVRQRIVGVAGIDTRAVVRHIRNFGSMKAGIFSGAALAEPDELIERVRAQPRCSAPTWPARSAPPIPMSSNPKGRIGLPSPHSISASKPTRRGTSPGAASAAMCCRRRRPSSRSPRSSRTACSCPTARRSGHGRPRRRRHPAGAGRRNPLVRHLFRQPDPGPRTGSVHLQDGVRPPRYQRAGDRPRHRADRDHGAKPRLRGARRSGSAIRHPVRTGDRQSHLRQRRRRRRRQTGQRRAFSVQYHPEAAAGPHDAEYLFDQFVDLMAGEGH